MLAASDESVISFVCKIQVEECGVMLFVFLAHGFE